MLDFPSTQRRHQSSAAVAARRPRCRRTCARCHANPARTVRDIDRSASRSTDRLSRSRGRLSGHKEAIINAAIGNVRAIAHSHALGTTQPADNWTVDASGRVSEYRVWPPCRLAADRARRPHNTRRRRESSPRPSPPPTIGSGAPMRGPRALPVIADAEVPGRSCDVTIGGRCCLVGSLAVAGSRARHARSGSRLQQAPSESGKSFVPEARLSEAPVLVARSSGCIDVTVGGRSLELRTRRVRWRSLNPTTSRRSAAARRRGRSGSTRRR